LATFPCATSQGCIVYAGGTASPYVETSLTLATAAAGVTAGLPLLAGTSAPGWGGAGLDLQGYAVVNEMTAVMGANAPVINQLVILSAGSASTVQVATTGSTTGVEGICIANCTSGASNAQIARYGVAGCKFYNATTIGDYVQIGTNGECNDYGPTYPFNGSQVLGRVLAACSSGATCAMMLYSGGIAPVTAATLTGTIGVGSGGTGQTTANAGFNALSPMTTLGDLITGGTSGVGTRLAGNSLLTPKYLKSLGTGTAATAETWTQVAAGDLSNGTTGTAGGVVLATGPTISAPSLTGLTTVQRISAANGTAQSASNIAISAAWGSTASVSAVAGTDTALTFAITPGGTGIGSGATITIMFADGSFISNPICVFQNSGVSTANNTLSNIKQSSVSGSQIVVTSATAGVSGTTYTFNMICFHQ
jgi:hypothetical protein